MSWPTPGASRLIDAMVHAEGGPEAMVRAVRISVPGCRDIAHARAVAANTIAHALWDYVMTSIDRTVAAENFVRFLGARWAPVGAANDPMHLNEHWTPNVLAYLTAHPEVTT